VKSTLTTAILVCISFSPTAMGTLVTVEYDVRQTEGIWEYDYTVYNSDLAPPLEAFTLWFDADLYENLVVTTPDPLSDKWEELILQPVPGLGYGYDLFANEEGLLPGETAQGFSIRFSWLGDGMPTSQLFSVTDPASFETVYEGFTVPEPSTFVLLSSVLLLRMRRRTCHRCG